MPGSVSQPLPSARAARKSGAQGPGAAALPRNDDWRDHFGVWVTVAALAFLAYALAAPALGAYAPAAPALGAYALAAPALGAYAPAAPVAAWLLRGSARAGLDAGVSALWLVLARFADGLPLGDPRVHVRAVSLAAAAIAVAALLWRAAHATHDLRVTNGRDRRDRLERTVGGAVAPIALSGAALVGALMGVLTAALSRSFCAAATTASPVAVGVLLALAPLLLAERALVVPSDRRAVLGLAVAVGALAGGPLVAAALGWPLAMLVGLRSMRSREPRRARWRPLVPVVAGTVAVISFVRLAVALAPAGFDALAGRLFLVPAVRALGRVSAGDVGRATADLADQVGILALLVAAAGLSRLRWPALLCSLWALVGGLMLRAALGAGGEGTIALIVAVSALAPPLAAGTVRLASRLGRAALPAAAAIAVMVTLWPLLAR